MHNINNMFSSILTEYVHSISKTRKGLRILIVDNLVIQQLAFLEITKHYLPESIAHAVDRVELEAQLKLNRESEYDLVILDEWFLFEEPNVYYISRVRRRFPRAKIALFIDRENLYRLHFTRQLNDIDTILAKCSTVEAIAEKLCLIFQES